MRLAGAIIKALEACLHWDLALHYVETMEALPYGILPNSWPIMRAIQLYPTELHQSGIHASRALATLEKQTNLQDKQVQPDLILFNTAMNAAAKAGEWQIALALVSSLARTHAQSV